MVMDEITKLLLYLYAGYQQDPTGYFRISKALNGNENWRTIAGKAFDLGYIEYPENGTYGSTARITQKGIDQIKQSIE